MGRLLTRVGLRVIGAVATLAAVSVLVFAMLHVIPGDPVEVMLGDSASQADRQALMRQLGLDQPLTTQFQRYLSGVVHGDLGESLLSRRPVAEMLGERLPYTVALAVAALLVAMLIGIPAGIAAAVWQGSLADRLLISTAVAGAAIPTFWLGPVLVLVFSLWLGWLPVSGSDSPDAIVLPVITLGTALAAVLARMTRGSMLEVLREPYIRTARARGVGPLRILMLHALPNAGLPLLTVLGLQLGSLLGGAVVTEVVFAWPGIGQLLVDSIERRDYPLVQGSVLLISAIYVLVNLLTDVMYTVLDPRTRLASA